MSKTSLPGSLHTSSQGHRLADAQWLDVHFEATRPEYEVLLRSVGLRPGWHVLDAGCGSGSFLPLIAAAVGPTGTITALDYAPENIAVIQQRIAGWSLDCPVSTRVGSLLDLQAIDGVFDAIWCANTSQYLSDDELRLALAAFRRVVRPGGVVALKEANIANWNFSPGGPERMWRALAATRHVDLQVHGMLRTPELRRWMESAGFEEVRQQSEICDRWAPLRASDRQLHGDLLRWLGQRAINTALSEDDLTFWRTMQHPDNPGHPINQPDFAVFDTQTVVVGRVPLAAN